MGTPPDPLDVGLGGGGAPRPAAPVLRDAARGQGGRRAETTADGAFTLRRGTRRPMRRTVGERRSFRSTLRALDELASSGAQVSVRVDDLDHGTAVLSGDDFVTLPVAGLGIVPLLVEVAAAIDAGTVDALEIIDREQLDPVVVAGIWQYLKAPSLPVVDLAVLAASSGDALAANALIDRVRLPAVRRRLERRLPPRSSSAIARRRGSLCGWQGRSAPSRATRACGR